jgi:hypothetical protein
MLIATMILATAATSSGIPKSPQAPKTGDDVIRAMHARYAGKWYKTLTFVQKTTQPNGTVETWYEAMTLPGTLRIDIAPLDSGKALFFRNDSIYQVNGGKVTQSGPLIHPLMVLGFDVYADPPEKTIDKLRRLRFDLTKLHAGSWQERRVWVVGADPGDEKTNQFWITQDDLLFVRMLRTGANGVTNETQFNRYFAVGGGWVAPEVLFFSNGQKGTVEEYADVQAGMGFSPDLFDPAKFARPDWVR